MAHFRKGRVEVHHIIGPAVARFLDGAEELTTPLSEQRQRFFHATKAHAKSLRRASKGRAFSRHMLAMEWMLRKREAAPDLFLDPIYETRKIPDKQLHDRMAGGVGNTTISRPKGTCLSKAEVAVMEERGRYSGPQLFYRTLSLAKK